MNVVEEIKQQIVSLYTDFKLLEGKGRGTLDEVQLAGYGEAPIISCLGKTKIISKFSNNEYSFIGSFPDEEPNHLVVEDLTVEFFYNSPVYILSDQGLIRYVASSYDYKAVVREHEFNYWPELVRRSLKNGELSIPWELPELARTYKRHRTAPTNPSSELDKAFLSINSLLEFRNYEIPRSLAVLSSINPYILAVPNQIVVNGETIKIDRESSDRDNATLNNLAGCPIPMPAVVISEATRVPLEKSYISRSDGIVKASGTVVESPIEAYIWGRNKVHFPNRLNVVSRSGLAASFFSTVGLGAVASQLNHSADSRDPVLIGVAVSATVGMTWFVSNLIFAPIVYVERYVKGNGNMKLWMKGYEM